MNQQQAPVSSATKSAHSKTVTLVKAKEVKHSIVYEATDPNACLKSVYLGRNYSSPMPTTIEILVTTLN